MLTTLSFDRASVLISNNRSYHRDSSLWSIVLVSTTPSDRLQQCPKYNVHWPQTQVLDGNSNENFWKKFHNLKCRIFLFDRFLMYKNEYSKKCLNRIDKNNNDAIVYNNSSLFKLYFIKIILIKKNYLTKITTIITLS